MVNRNWLFRTLANGKHMVNPLALGEGDAANTSLHTLRASAVLENTAGKEASEGMPVLSLNG